MTTGKFSGIDTTELRGIRVCKCPLCFERFSGESTFVAHRIAYAKVNRHPGAYALGECRHPESKGLVLNESGVWYLPLPEHSHLKRLNAERRSR